MFALTSRQHLRTPCGCGSDASVRAGDDIGRSVSPTFGRGGEDLAAAESKQDISSFGVMQFNAPIRKVGPSTPERSQSPL